MSLLTVPWRPIAAASLGAFLVATAPGCSGPTERTALALTEPAWIDETTLRLEVECSSGVEVRVEEGAGLEGVPLVTVWGHPESGRCRIPVRIEPPISTPAIEDGTTGMVVELPPRPAP